MTAQGNVGLAFGLVIAAGLSTSIGAALVFFVRPSNYVVLAAALAASAGVMMYVSIVEIFMSKSVAAFAAHGLKDNEAYRYATLCFFGGIFITWGLNIAVHTVLHLNALIQRKRASQSTPTQQRLDVEPGQPAPAVPAAQQDTDNTCPAVGTPVCLGHSCHLRHQPPSSTGALDTSAALSTSGSEPPPGMNPPAVALPCLDDHDHDHAKASMMQMGLLTCLAVAVHNLPEGLATFVGALASPSTGVAIALAIALHNIPEGVVVAMPLYCATGSKWKAFMWSTVSGLAEVAGGVLGFLLLYGNNMSQLAYALLFGLVAGVMVYISIKELVPTALKYDPQNHVVSKCFILGMVVMAASLLLFQV